MREVLIVERHGSWGLPWSGWLLDCTLATDLHTVFSEYLEYTESALRLCSSRPKLLNLLENCIERFGNCLLPGQHFVGFSWEVMQPWRLWEFQSATEMERSLTWNLVTCHGICIILPFKFPHSSFCMLLRDFKVSTSWEIMRLSEWH